MDNDAKYTQAMNEHAEAWQAEANAHRAATEGRGNLEDLLVMVATLGGEYEARYPSFNHSVLMSYREVLTILRREVYGHVAAEVVDSPVGHRWRIELRHMQGDVVVQFHFTGH